MSELAALPRLWPTIRLPGIAEGRATYWMLDLEAMPPIERPLDGTLQWLLDEPVHNRSLARSSDDAAVRDADSAGLQAVVPGLALPAAFGHFIEDPKPRGHLRSATACYLDLGQLSVDTTDGGRLIHFLSDQQSVLHWLLYVGRDGSEAVVATWDALGFDTGEGEPIRTLDLGASARSLAVCADTFEEFVYRYWAMNELFFRLAVDKLPLATLPAELRTYAERYPRTASLTELVGGED